MGDEAKYIHMGLTSTDVKDTGLNVQLKQASAVLLDDLQKLADVLKRRAVEFKHTPPSAVPTVSMQNRPPSA